MIDLRLNPVTSLIDNVSEIILKYRNLFIALEAELVKLGSSCHTGHRNLAIARTHLEDASMHVIKAICLQSEKK